MTTSNEAPFLSYKITIISKDFDKLEGRPVNGMFTALPKDLWSKAKDISPHNERIQGIILDTDEDSFLIVNAYFPPYPKTKKYNQDAELEDVLPTIENMKEKAEQCQKCQSCTRMERCCKAILRGSKILAFHLDISW